MLAERPRKHAALIRCVGIAGKSFDPAELLWYPLLQNFNIGRSGQEERKAECQHLGGSLMAAPHPIRTLGSSTLDVRKGSF
jgi:hypothetical protein